MIGRLLCRLGLHWRLRYDGWDGSAERYCARYCGARWLRRFERWVRL